VFSGLSLLPSQLWSGRKPVPIQHPNTHDVSALFSLQCRDVGTKHNPVIVVRSDITWWYMFSVLEGCDHGIADFGEFHIDTRGKDIHMVSGIMRPNVQVRVLWMLPAICWCWQFAT
jgi:hypothetical protein